MMKISGHRPGVGSKGGVLPDLGVSLKVFEYLRVLKCTLMLRFVQVLKCSAIIEEV